MKKSFKMHSTNKKYYKKPKKQKSIEDVLKMVANKIPKALTTELWEGKTASDLISGFKVYLLDDSIEISVRFLKKTLFKKTLFPF